jgi:hypothetical protein
MLYFTPAIGYSSRGVVCLGLRFIHLLGANQIWFDEPMFFVKVDTDDPPPEPYRWCIYDDQNPAQPVRRADHPYPSRAAAIDAGWAVVARLERDRT